MIIYSSSGSQIINVILDDSSTYNHELMGEEYLTLRFSLDYYIEFPQSCYCMHNSMKFLLFVLPEVKQHNTRYYDYTLKMESEFMMMKYIMLRDNDGRISFSFTGTALEHLTLVSNTMLHRANVTFVKDSEIVTEGTITYDNVTVFDALRLIADTFKTEWWTESVTSNIKGIHIGKCELYKQDPLAISYGRGNGIIGGTVKKSHDGEPLVRCVYPLCSDRNVTLATYGKNKLHMPSGNQILTIGYDGAHFSWEAGYTPSAAKQFDISKDGLYMSLHKDNEYISVGEMESTIDCIEIYPRRIGVVDSVTKVSANDGDKYYITDTIPSTLPNYSQLVIEGMSLYIVFQSGELAGREFNVTYRNTASGNAPAKSFEIISIEEDGYIMPSQGFEPKHGDKYVVFNCALPQQYIRDDNSHSGAEWELAKKVAMYLFDKEKTVYSLNIELDGIWARDNWDDISIYARCGAYVEYSDDDMQENPILLRIVSISQCLNYPYNPELVLSHEPAKTSLKGRTLIMNSSTVGSIKIQERVTTQIETIVNRLEKQQSVIVQDVSQIQEQLNNTVS